MFRDALWAEVFDGGARGSAKRQTTLSICCQATDGFDERLLITTDDRSAMRAVEQVFAGVPELSLRANGLDEIQLVGLGRPAAGGGADPSGGKGHAGLTEGGFR